jgi:hypothetical protein
MRKFLLLALTFALLALPVAASAQEAEPPPRVVGSVLPSYGHLHPFAGAKVMRVEIMTRAD